MSCLQKRENVFLVTLKMAPGHKPRTCRDGRRADHNATATPAQKSPLVVPITTYPRNTRLSQPVEYQRVVA